ncbi:MAG: hypothetical protein ACLR60_05230, partial [Clostridium paraputrificum]
KIVVTGTKNIKASSTQVDLDKIVISNTVPTLSAGTFQEDNSALIYSGPWNLRQSSNYDNGALKMSTANSSVEFKFNGTSFTWYGTKAASRGIAKVYIDGSLVDTVDTYSASTSFKTPIYKSNTLTSGTHTVKIVVTGTKNIKASSTQVDFDKIVLK